MVQFSIVHCVRTFSPPPRCVTSLRYLLFASTSWMFEEQGARRQQAKCNAVQSATTRCDVATCDTQKRIAFAFRRASVSKLVHHHYFLSPVFPSTQLFQLPTDRARYCTVQCTRRSCRFLFSLRFLLLRVEREQLAGFASLFFFLPPPCWRVPSLT